MGHAKFIGRIGALAVALGIGATVGTGVGLPVAFAEGTGDTTNTDTTTNVDAPDGTGAGGTTSTGVTTAPTVADPTPTTGVETPGAGTPPATPQGPGPVVVVGDGRNGTTPPSTGATSPPSTPSTASPTPTATPTPTPTNDPPTSAPPNPPAKTRNDDTIDPALNAPIDVHPTPAARAQDAPALRTQSSTNTAASLASLTADLDSPAQSRFAALQSNPVTQSTTSPSAQSVPAALLAPAAPPPPPVNIVTAVLSAFGFTPLLAPGPGTPAATPGIWTLLAWVRREIEQTFFNHTPTLKPTQNSLIVDENGAITGSLGASDPDEGETEGLTYRLVQDAAHGHVVIHDDGTWTYTANDGYSGPDSFQAMTSDADTGWHLHGLLQSLFSPNGGATQTATVNLVALQAAHVAGSPLRLAGEPIGAPVFSQDGKTGWQLARNAATPEGYELVKFDVPTGQLKASLRTNYGTPTDDGLVLGANGTRAYFATKNGSGSTNVTVVALDDSGQLFDTIGLNGVLMDPDDVVLSADGKRVYVTTRITQGPNETTTLAVIDLQSRQQLGEQQEFRGRADGHIVETPDGTRILLAVDEDPEDFGYPRDLFVPTTRMAVLDARSGAPVGPEALVFGGVLVQGPVTLNADGTKALVKLGDPEVTPDSATLVFIDVTNGTAAHPVSIQSDATARFVGDGSTAQLVTLVAATPLHDASYFVTVLDTASGADLGSSTNLHFNSLQPPVATYADNGTGYYVVPRSDQTDVYAIGPDGTARVFVVEGTFIRGAIFRPTRSAIVLNADQSRLYVTTVTGPDDATTVLTAINVATGTSSNIQLDGSLNSPMVTNEQHTRAILFTHTPGATNETGSYATVIDLATGQPVGSPIKLTDDGVPGFPRATFTTDGNKAYVVVAMRSTPPGQGSTALTAIDLVTGGAIGSTTADGEPPDFIDGQAPGLVLGADGMKGFLVTERVLATGEHELVVTGLDLTRTSVASNPVVLAGPGQGPTFTVNEAGTLAVFSRRGSNTLFDLNGHSVKVSARDSSGIVDTTFSPDGNAAYMRASDHHDGAESTGITTVVRTPSGELTTLQLELPDYAAGNLSPSPDGARAILATRTSGDDFLHFIDLGTATTLPDVVVPESVVPINPAQALREWIEHTFFI